MSGTVFLLLFAVLIFATFGEVFLWGKRRPFSITGQHNRRHGKINWTLSILASIVLTVVLTLAVNVLL